MERETETASTPKGNKSGGLGAKAIIAPKQWLFAESVRLLTFFLFCFVFAVFFSLVILSNKGCSLEDFQCWDFTCITKEQFCDGAVLDCSQGEDEEEAYCQMRGQLNSLRNVFKDLAGEHSCELDGIPGVSSHKPHKSKWHKRKAGRFKTKLQKHRRKNSAKTMKILTKKFFKRVNRNLLRGHFATNLFHKERNEEGNGDKLRDLENSEMKDAENPEMKDAENPEMKDAENSEMKDAANPEMKDAENPEVKGAENPEMKDAENPEMKDAENPEMKDAENPEMKDAENPEMKDAENPEMKDAENPEMKDAEKPKMIDAEKPEMKDAEKPEMKDTEKPEMKEGHFKSLSLAKSKSVLGSLSLNTSYFYSSENLFDSKDEKGNLSSEENNFKTINKTAELLIEDANDDPNVGDDIRAINVKETKTFLTNSKPMNHDILTSNLKGSLNETEKELYYSETIDQKRQKFHQFLANDSEIFLEFFVQKYITKSIDENSNFDVAKNEDFKVSNVSKVTPNGLKRRNDINVTNPYFEKLRKDKYKELLTKGIYNNKESEGGMKKFYDSLHKFLLNAHSLKIYPDIRFKVIPATKYKKKINKLNLENFVDSFLMVFPEGEVSALNGSLVKDSKKSITEIPPRSNYSSGFEMPSFANLTTSLNVDENEPPLPEIVEIFKDAINSSFIEFVNELEPKDLENLTYFETTQKEIDGATGQTVWKLEPAFNELLIKVFEDAKNSYLESNTSSNGTPPGFPVKTTADPKLPSGKVIHVEQSHPDCSCELRTVVKCNNVTNIPANITGGMTKLVLSNNRITDIDYNAMRRYRSLQQGLYLQNNLIVTIPPRVFSSQKILKRLFLHENRISTINADSCIGLSQLEIFHLYENNLTNIDLHCFQHTPLLHTLLLSRNKLTLVDEEFPYLENLKFLDLQKNRIPFIQKLLFAKLTSLKTLSLQHNKIASIHPSAFENLRKLEDLDLSNNRILKNVANVFMHLTSLQSLNLRGVQLDATSSVDYENLTSLKRVFFPRLRYCAFVEQVDHCEPRSDGITSKQDLMQSLFLRLCVWLVVVLTLLGNFVVLLCRGISGNDEKVLVFFIRNLAMSDLLMGLYLVIVGIQDQRTRGSFYRHANWWTSSKWCILAGCLAMVSSEASMFILAYMSLHRYLYITRTLRGNELSMSFARKSMAVIWITAIIIALFPVFGMTNFYGMNAMCLPLHISEPYFEGWQFSAFVFLGLNSFCMFVIIGSYVGLFINIKITRSKTPLSKTDLSFVLRFLFIVLTDVICWMPILACKLVALAEIPITGEIYAWLVVLVVPINSAINPFLYTFSTNHFLAAVQKVVNKVNPSRLTKNSDTSATYRRSSTRSRHCFLPEKDFQNFQRIPPNISSVSDSNSHGVPVPMEDNSNSTEYESQLVEHLDEITVRTEDRLTIEIIDNENSCPTERGEISRVPNNLASSPSSPAIRLTCRLKNVGSLSLTVVREIKNDEQSFYRRQEYDVSPRKKTFPDNIRPETMLQKREKNYARISSNENDISKKDLSDYRINRNIELMRVDQNDKELREYLSPLSMNEEELNQIRVSNSSNDGLTDLKSPKFYCDEKTNGTLKHRDSSKSLLCNEESDRLTFPYSDNDGTNFVDG